MRKIAGEAVGDVDRCVRQATQALAELDARLGGVQPFRRLRDVRMRQAERGAAELARHPDVVPWARAAALQRSPGGHLANRGDAERAQRAAKLSPPTRSTR